MRAPPATLGRLGPPHPDPLPPTGGREVTVAPPPIYALSDAYPIPPYSAATFSASPAAFSAAALASTNSTICSTIRPASIVWSVLPAA